MTGASPDWTIADDLLPRLVESIDAVTYVLRVGRGDEPPLYVSPQALEVLGFPSERLHADALGRNQLLHPEDRERIWKARGETDGIGAGRFDEEYRIVLEDGSVRWVRDQARVLPATGDHPALWLGLLTDVTRAKHEEQIARYVGDARFRTLIETLPAVVYIDSHERSPVSMYVSPQTETISGYTPEEWVADPDLWWKVIHPDDRDRLDRHWALAHEDDGVHSSEYRIFHRDGRLVWLEDVATLIRADDGTPMFWQGITFDVTDRKRAEEELAESEHRYRALVEQLPGTVYLCTDERDPVTTYVSPGIVELTGASPERWTGDRDLWLRTVHPTDQERVRDAWIDAVAAGKRFAAEYRAVHRDGSLRWVSDEASLIFDDAGRPLLWQGLMRDITAEKRWATELQESEARYRALVEQVPAVVYRMGPDDERRTLYVSPHVEHVLGYTRQEWLDQPDIWVELLHPDDREIELEAHDRLTETGEPWSQEYRLIANDGRTVWVRDQAVLTRDAGGDPVWEGVLLDITAQKELEQQLREMNDMLELRVLERTTELEDANEMMALEIGERLRIENELREAQRRYRRLVEDLPAVVYTWHPAQPSGGSPEYASPRIESILGYTPAEWGDPNLWSERLHPHDRERVLEAAASSAATGEPFEQEYRMFAKDGHVVWVLNHASLLSRDEAGRPAVFQGVLLDISARKEAEEKAREVEERYRELADTGPAIVATYDLDTTELVPGRVLHISPRFEEIMGIGATTSLESSPERWSELLHPDDLARVLEETHHHWSTGEPLQTLVRLVAPEGRIVWTLATSVCVGRDDQGKPQRFQSLLVDVTDRQVEEERLRHDERTFRSLIELMPGIPWIEVNEGEPGTGRMTYIGPQVEAVLGYTATELLDEPGHFERMVHPDDLQRMMELSALHDRTLEPWFAEHRAIARNGSVHWLRSVGAGSRDEHGRTIWYGVTYDITTEKESRERSKTVETAEIDR